MTTANEPKQTDSQNPSPGIRAFENYDFRDHYNANYANSGYRYEQFVPAYRYGYNLAEDSRFQGWDTFEAEVRRQWEMRNPDTWDRFKDAIRYAWEQVRGAAPTGQ